MIGAWINPNALATIAVDKVAWREPANRAALAAEILQILLTAKVIKIGQSPRGLHRAGKDLSDKQIRSVVKQHINFVRSYHEPCPVPPWLPELMRLAAFA